MKDKLLKGVIVVQNEVKGLFKPKTKVALKTDAGETYVDTGVKVVIAIVIGSLLLVGFMALTSTTILPTLKDNIELMFDKYKP